jgi:hypothetical protein
LRDVGRNSFGCGEGQQIRIDRRFKHTLVGRNSFGCGEGQQIRIDRRFKRTLVGRNSFGCGEGQQIRIDRRFKRTLVGRNSFGCGEGQQIRIDRRFKRTLEISFRYIKVIFVFFKSSKGLVYFRRLPIKNGIVWRFIKKIWELGKILRVFFK